MTLNIIIIIIIEGVNWKIEKFKDQLKPSSVEGVVAELTYLHVQSAWGSKGERVRTAGLTACCNYF